MPNEVVTFQFGTLPFRSIQKDGNPWFVLSDVCRALDIGNSRMAAARLDLDERNTVSLTDGNRGNPNVTIINESGLYSMILRCQKATTPGSPAHTFKRWVTSEVLPSLRKDGVYVAGEEKVVSGEMSEDELILKAVTALQTKVARLSSERDTLKIANVEMEKELNEVTIDEFRALKHKYWSLGKTQRIARAATRLADRLGVTLGLQDRTVRRYNKEYPVKLKVYPRDILEEAYTEVTTAGFA